MPVTVVHPVRPLAGLIGEDAVLERVADGCLWTEGPLWIPLRGVLRWSDIPANRILEYAEALDEVTVYATDAEFPNGRALAPDGSVIQCSHGRRRVERDSGGTVTSIVDSWSGHRLNSPNDVVIAADGAVWFTDPSYGITEPREGHPGEREYGDHWVFRYSVGELRPAVLDVEEPNGLAFSPDGRILYVADSSSVRKPEGVGNSWIRAYDVDRDGRCKNGRVFARIEPGFPDGIAVDENGNVWSSSADGVIVFSPAGSELGRIAIPELVGNLCFGGADGRTLYVAASTSIYRVRTLVRDGSPAGGGQG
ncbi:SMP-30/gluconolactonase/LRE family protein [Naasia aerilata]|nr:SMP-30/gluconolactonase/LRE family protein [Naasia aerilata]